MSKIKRDDDVVVIAGKDRGKRGTVTRVLDSDRVYVSGINMIKRHTKGNPQMGQAGGIIEKEAPIHVSNIAIFNPEISKADRIGYAVGEDGSKARVYKSSGEKIDG